MQSNTAFKLAPAVAGDRRIDVSVEDESAIVQLSDWIEGLGWSTQKTMKLDEELLDEMHMLITAARLKMKRQRSMHDENAVPAKVLSFPRFD